MDERIIVNNAKDILYNLGTIVREDGQGDLSVINGCVYKGFGLDIAAHNLPGYFYEDKKTGRYIPELMRLMEYIVISYNGSEVFNTRSRINKPGIWQDILDELHSKVPVLRKAIDEKFKRDSHCLQLMRQVLQPLFDRKVSTISASLGIGHYDKESGVYNSNGDFINETHYYVRKDGEEVLHLKKLATGDYTVTSYTPGNWESELADFLPELDRRKTQKDLEDGVEYLRQLRGI